MAMHNDQEFKQTLSELSIDNEAQKQYAIGNDFKSLAQLKGESS